MLPTPTITQHSLAHPPYAVDSVNQHSSTAQVNTINNIGNIVKVKVEV